MFKLVLTENGKVASIQILKSTGSKILDDAAEKALIQWRFKPGFVRAVNVPINLYPEGSTRATSKSSRAWLHQNAITCTLTKFDRAKADAALI